MLPSLSQANLLVARFSRVAVLSVFSIFNFLGCRNRAIIILVKAGAPVDDTIETLSQYLEKGDCIIDGGNEW